MLEVARASLPMFIVLAIGVALITAFPQLTLALPRWVL
jgi:TRAP-type C4-dicarboxylate transport system permease large subunit